MPSIKKAATLTKEIIAINWLANSDGLNICPLLNGPHGIGKSQIVRQVAKDMKGYCYTVDCSTLKEGEITGLPFAQKNEDDTSEVRFIKYYSINRIWQLEKFYYEQATTKGFLNGTVKLVVDENGNETLVENGKKTLVRTAIDKVEAGEDNRYKFGGQLSPETKIRLIESGEIKPVVIFADELNRAEQQTMKEMMNIILNKSVNGYDLPWFVSIVSAVNPCSQNSTYATNELDDAQLDRFLKIKVDANLEDWIDYAVAKNLPPEIPEALSVQEAIFIHREKGQEDTSEMYPSPRSWEMVSNIYEYIQKAVSTSFFTPEEREKVNDDMRILIRGKVGETAARTILETIARKENNIKPQEILTAKSPKIDEKVVAKFSSQKRLTQKIIAASLVNYIEKTIFDMEKNANSGDAKAKEAYMNYMSQLKEFANLLGTPVNQLEFVKNFINRPNGGNLFMKAAKAFSTEILAQVNSAKSALRDLTENN